MDGKKIQEKVGLEFFLFQQDLELSYHEHCISDNCSVFQAELLCLNFGVKHILRFQVLKSLSAGIRCIPVLLD